MNMDLIRDRMLAFKHNEPGVGFSKIRSEAIDLFEQVGIPTSRNEEWKYTRLGGLFQSPFTFPEMSMEVIEYSANYLPGHDTANVIVFVDGVYSSVQSKVTSQGLQIMSLEEGYKKYPSFVEAHLGDSQRYIRDGIIALNTALIHGGVFIFAEKGKLIDKPLYIYHLVGCQRNNMLSQPRSLVHIAPGAQLQIVETYVSIGQKESLTNEVMEVIVEEGALFDYVKIQHDAIQSNHLGTTYIRQIGKSVVHTVNLTFQGKLVRNNIQIIMEAMHSEAYLYGLYVQDDKMHVDNHTVVDNRVPNCYSNELYKGVLTGHSTGVFNGKIFVREDAQKINAFQSNKNILLSETATINTKPQLEIYADDVKCSHGCTVGRLDEEGLFYLQSRGVSEGVAKALMLHSFMMDVLEQIKDVKLREYIDQLIVNKLHLS